MEGVVLVSEGLVLVLVSDGRDSITEFASLDLSTLEVRCMRVINNVLTTKSTRITFLYCNQNKAFQSHLQECQCLDLTDIHMGYWVVRYN